MKTLNEAARCVDVVLETDVLVVGSGPGGLAAALASARAGARTALIEFEERAKAMGAAMPEPQSPGMPISRFGRALRAGVIPANLTTIAGTWGTVSDQGDLTGQDVREQGRFADSIGIFPEFIDGYGILIIPTTGRSIGGDRVSHAAVRNMMCCAVSGQGAGVAAAVSLRTGQPFDRLDIEAVQTELRRQGARIQ